MGRRSMIAAKAMQSVVASSWWHFDGAVHERDLLACCLLGLVQVVGDRRSRQYCNIILACCILHNIAFSGPLSSLPPTVLRHTYLAFGTPVVRSTMMRMCVQSIAQIMFGSPAMAWKSLLIYTCSTAVYGNLMYRGW